MITFHETDTAFRADVDVEIIKNINAFIKMLEPPKVALNSVFLVFQRLTLKVTLVFKVKKFILL